MLINYKGMICFGETDYDGGSNSDEIYCITTISTFEVGWLREQAKPTVRTAMFGVYDDVDAGEVYADNNIIYIGNAQDMTFTATCMEYDYGDPNALKSETQKVAQAAAEAAKSAGYEVPDWITGVFASVANALFGTGDDNLGTDSKVFTAAQLNEMAGTPPMTERGIPYHFFTYHSGENSTYKFYFQVIP